MKTFLQFLSEQQTENKTISLQKNTKLKEKLQKFFLDVYQIIRERAKGKYTSKIDFSKFPKPEDALKATGEFNGWYQDVLDIFTHFDADAEDHINAVNCKKMIYKFLYEAFGSNKSETDVEKNLLKIDLKNDIWSIDLFIEVCYDHSPEATEKTEVIGFGI